MRFIFKKLDTVNNPKSVHGIYPYRGKISGKDANLIIDEINSKFKIKQLLDPFCGTGTINFECQKKFIKNIGLDLNPVAVNIANSKINQKKIELELKIFQKIKKKSIKETEIIISPLFKKYFHRDTALRIYQYSNYLDEMSDYIRGCYFGSIALSARGCNHYKWTSNIVGKIIKPFKYVDFDKIFYQKIIKHHEKTKNISKIKLADVKNINKKVKKNTVNCVITSPPYFNALDYTSYHNQFILEILKINKLPLKENLFQSLKNYETNFIEFFKNLEKILDKKSLIVFIVGGTKRKYKSNNINLSGSEFFIKISPFKLVNVFKRNYTNTSSSNIIDKINKTSREEEIIVWKNF